MRRGIALAGMLLVTGCDAIPIDKKTETQYYNLIQQGAEPVEKYNPTVACLMQIGLSSGDLYTEQYGLAMLNFVLWPYSLIWSIAGAYEATGRANKIHTVWMYSTGPLRGQYDPDYRPPRVIDPKAPRAAKAVRPSHVDTP